MGLPEGELLTARLRFLRRHPSISLGWRRFFLPFYPISAMGVVVSSLHDLPEQTDRKYFIYLLDYGWHENLGSAMMQNFERIASDVSRHGGVVIRAGIGHHFADEVLSWHRINGLDVEGQDLLPAIVITNRPPIDFREGRLGGRNGQGEAGTHLVVLPIKKFCHTTTDVVELLKKIVSDIRQGKDLKDFQVASIQQPGVMGAIVNSVILEPNVAGVGFSFNKLLKALGL